MISNGLRRAVFLDRDGTLNRDKHYLARVEDFEWIPGVIEALQALDNGGFVLVVVTNQSGIAQGLFDEAALAQIHGHMVADLLPHGVSLAGIYHCPHHPTLGADPGPCPCRKPAPGLLRLAASDLGLDLQHSWMVGDSLRDLQAADHLDMPSILVRTGKGAEQERRLKVHPELRTWVAEDLAQAAEFILSHESSL